MKIDDDGSPNRRNDDEELIPLSLPLLVALGFPTRRGRYPASQRTTTLRLGDTLELTCPGIAAYPS